MSSRTRSPESALLQRSIRMLGDVKMFCRVAGWSAAFLIPFILVWPEASGLDTNSFIEAVTPPAAAGLAVARDQIETQLEHQTADQPTEPAVPQTHHEAQLPLSLSARDQAAPLVEAPMPPNHLDMPSCRS